MRLSRLWLVQGVLIVIFFGVALLSRAWETTTTTTEPPATGVCASPCPQIPDCRLVVGPDPCRIIWTHRDRPGWVKVLRRCPA